MIHVFLPLVFLFSPPAAVQKCVGAEPVEPGHIVSCRGILWGIASTRRAVECKEVVLPKLNALLTRCETTNNATIDYLERRALSAENTLKLIPRPMSKVSTIMIGLSILSVGFLAGFTVGLIK